MASPGLLTTTIVLECTANGQVSLFVWRELPSDSDAPAFRVTAGADLILDDNERTGSIGKLNRRAKILPGHLIQRAAATEAIVLRETTGTNRRQTEFSTKGLREALAANRGRCV